MRQLYLNMFGTWMFLLSDKKLEKNHATTELTDIDRVEHDRLIQNHTGKCRLISFSSVFTFPLYYAACLVPLLDAMDRAERFFVLLCAFRFGGCSVRWKPLAKEEPKRDSSRFRAKRASLCRKKSLINCCSSKLLHLTARSENFPCLSDRYRERKRERERISKLIERKKKKEEGLKLSRNLF